MRNPQEPPVQPTRGERQFPLANQLRQVAFAITLAALLFTLPATVGFLFAASAYLVMRILAHFILRLLLAAGALGFIAAVALEVWVLFSLHEDF